MKRPSFKTILICLGLFLFFLLVRFPMQNLRGYIFSQINKQTGIQITAEGMSLNLFGWPGLEMRNVDVEVPPQTMGSSLELSAKDMVGRVGLGGLFPPSLSYSMNLSSLKKGGDLYVKVSHVKLAGQNFVSADLNFSADSLALDQIPLDQSEPMHGKLTADGDLSMDKTDLSKTAGDLDLNLQGFKTPGQNFQGIIIPSINWGAIKAKISIKAGVIEIKNFQIGGPGSDVQGSMAGEIRLGRDFMGTFLNITSLKLTFSDAFLKNPNSDTIISTLNSIDKRSPGNYSFKWTKSVAAIAQNAFNNLPEKN